MTRLSAAGRLEVFAVGQGGRWVHHFGGRLHHRARRWSWLRARDRRRAPALLGVRWARARGADRRGQGLAGGGYEREWCGDRRPRHLRGCRALGGKNPWAIPFFVVTHRPEEEPPGGEFVFAGSLAEAIAQAKAATSLT